MALQDQSRHTGQAQASLSSRTSTSSPKSESNDFVALPFSSSWSHRISRSTLVRPKLLCLLAPSSSSPKSEGNEFVACQTWGTMVVHKNDGKIISFVFVKVGEKCIRRPPISLVMVSQDQSKHIGQTQAPLSSGTLKL